MRRPRSMRAVEPWKKKKKKKKMKKYITLVVDMT
jgi:hypothetical protein